MTNPNTYNTACMTGVIDNVDFTLRDDSTSVTMLIPYGQPEPQGGGQDHVRDQWRADHRGGRR